MFEIDSPDILIIDTVVFVLSSEAVSTTDNLPFEEHLHFPKSLFVNQAFRIFLCLHFVCERCHRSNPNTLTVWWVMMSPLLPLWKVRRVLDVPAGEGITLEDVHSGASSGSDDGSDIEEEEEEEEDEVRSVDEHLHIKAHDDDEPEGDGSAGSSTDVLYNPSIDEGFMASIKDLSDDDLEKWGKETETELRKKISQFKFVKKMLDEKVKKTKAAEAKIRQKEAYERRKTEKRELREAVITVNCQMPDGSTVPVKTFLGETVGGLRLLGGQSIGMAKAKTAKMMLVFNDKTISDAPRKTLGGAGLSDGCVVSFRVRGQGGGKSAVKKKLMFKKKCITATADKDLEMFKSAHESAKLACSFASVSIPDMVKTLPTKSLKEFKDYLEHHKANIDIKLQSAGDFSIESVKMMAVKDKLDFALEHMRDVVFHALLNHYGNKDGNIKIADVVKDLDIQLAIRAETTTGESADTSMKD